MTLLDEQVVLGQDEPRDSPRTEATAWYPASVLENLHVMPECSENTDIAAEFGRIRRRGDPW
jgi:hypothetical protein